MHAPDGFLEPSVAVITAVIAFVAVSAGVRYAGRELGDRQVPLAGVAAAFIFAAQMVNFPVAAGTTGHLVGGALAALRDGPRSHGRRPQKCGLFPRILRQDVITYCLRAA